MTVKIAIVGGGFAGLKTARLLARRMRGVDAHVTLIDGSPFHTLRPKLPQAVGGRIPCSVHLPFEEIVQGSGIEFIQRRVAGIDPALKRIWFETTGDSANEASPEVGEGAAPPLEFYDADIVVIASGGEAKPEVTVEPGGTVIPAWSFDQACSIRRRIGFLSQAAKSGKPVNPSVVIVGGGFVGVELAAEIHDRLGRLGMIERGAKTILVEAEPRILPKLNEKASSLALRHLQHQGVEVRTSSPALAVTKEGVRLEGGEVIEAGTVIWAGGVASKSLLQEPSLLDEEGRILVDKSLRVDPYPGVYALGDCARIRSSDETTNEASAHRAEAHAQIVAANVIATLRGEALKSVQPEPNVYLLGLGANYGILSTSEGSRALGGRLLIILKEGVMLRHLWQIGGPRLAMRAAKPVLTTSFRSKDWDGEPLKEGNALS